ncbi:MAG: DUF721 domain-containing protein [Pirellulaceae bacterium]
MSSSSDEPAKRHPRRIGLIVNQLMTRRGYGQVRTQEDIARIIQLTVGKELAKACRPGHVRRGLLEIGVTDSVAVQELSFQKRVLVKALQKEFPQSGIKDIRFRVG